MAVNQNRVFPKIQSHFSLYLVKWVKKRNNYTTQSGYKRATGAAAKKNKRRAIKICHEKSVGCGCTKIKTTTETTTKKKHRQEKNIKY